MMTVLGLALRIATDSVDVLDVCLVAHVRVDEPCNASGGPLIARRMKRYMNDVGHLGLHGRTRCVLPKPGHFGARWEGYLGARTTYHDRPDDVLIPVSLHGCHMPGSHRECRGQYILDHSGIVGRKL